MVLNFKKDCETCKILKEQLEFERNRNQELTETLTSLVKPRIILSEPVEHKPISPQHRTWTRRREEIERLDRERARVMSNSPVVAKPAPEPTSTEVSGAIAQLEMELGIGGEDASR